MRKSKFEEQVLIPIREHLAKNAERDAFLIAGEKYSYAELGERISVIRKAIKSVETCSNIFALAVHDDMDTYAAILALWMEGKAYVPLHPNQPIERNLNIIGQIGTQYIIDSAEASVFETSGKMVICTSRLAKAEVLLDKWVETNDEELAYILFTSGSTGTPKGVCLTRKNIGTFMDSFWKTGIEVDEHDKCLQAFDLTFDVSIQSFLTGLTRGACVCTIPYGQVKYLSAAALIMEEGITFGAMAPSMLTYLRPYFEEMRADSLKTCILTAEACPVDLMEDWYKCAVNTEIYDFYGPTEATIYCTYYKLHRDRENLSSNGIISIGKPLANVQAIIIGEKGELLGEGEKGELCVAGDQVAQGYWQNPEKNESSFFKREIDGVQQRFYHTGDLCHWDKSGNIIYSGRIDQQAKIQGFRVELGEIEYHARNYYENKTRVVAMAFVNSKGLTEIALFVESKPSDPAGLVTYMESKMPHYMIPTRILFEEVLPLNNSDKIDRAALKLRLK